MTLANASLLILGIALLVAGAEFLVRGAASMAARLGISPLAIGLTVVAYGTSSPEFAASVVAGARGQADLAIGNVLGSNIFNVLFILGLCALITPLSVASSLVRIDVPIMLGVSVLACLAAYDGTIGPLDGLLLLGGGVAYTVFAYRQARAEARAGGDAGSPAISIGSWPADLARVLGGLVVLVLGARALVASSVKLASDLGVSETIIGLTIVAAGTSMPEVATSVLAGIRGQRDIAVGNVVGSNIFNILGVLGASAVASGSGLPVAPGLVNFDAPVMIGAALLCLPIFFTEHRIARWEGALMLALYVCYTAFLIMKAADHDALPAFGAAMAAFVLPMTAATLAILSWRHWRGRDEAEAR